MLAVFCLARAIRAGRHLAAPAATLPAPHVNSRPVQTRPGQALVPSRDPGGAESPVWEIAQSVLRNARGPLRFLRVVLAMWAKKAGSEGDLAAVAGGYFAKLLVGPW